MIKFVLLLIIIIVSVKSIMIKPSKLVVKALSSSVLAIGLSFSPISAGAVNDAFEGAMKAMTSTKEKSIEDREFDELPKASKKRKAIEYCKDSARLKNSVFKSPSDCTAAVIEGDFSIVTGSAVRKASPPTTTSTTTSKSTLPSSGAVSRQTSSPKADAVAEKLEKVENLSDLSIASKKRRSLAACKKASTRKVHYYSVIYQLLILNHLITSSQVWVLRASVRKACLLEIMIS